MRTLDGNELAATANHPILTREGWKAARLINEGEHVLSERIASTCDLLRAEKYQQPPAMIENVVDALRSHGFTTYEIRALDFHGDAKWMNREIEIVGPARLLQNRMMAESDQACSQFPFMFADLQKPSRYGLRMLDFRLKRDGLSDVFA